MDDIREALRSLERQRQRIELIQNFLEKADQECVNMLREILQIDVGNGEDQPSEQTKRNVAWMMLRDSIERTKPKTLDVSTAHQMLVRSGYPFKASTSEANKHIVRHAFKSLLRRGIIKVAKEGSGSIPTIYTYTPKENRTRPQGLVGLAIAKREELENTLFDKDTTDS